MDIHTYTWSSHCINCSDFVQNWEHLSAPPENFPFVLTPITRGRELAEAAPEAEPATASCWSLLFLLRHVSSCRNEIQCRLAIATASAEMF